MKRFILSISILFCLSQGYAQQRLTLDSCYRRAEANYPLIRQQQLIRKSKALAVSNAATGMLPQVMLGGQATYQSDVTQVPFSMPGREIDPLSKDQYKVFAEVSQTLYLGGLVQQQKTMEEMNGAVEDQKLAVELYQVRNRVNELFFGILLLQEQAAQNELVKQDIAAGIKKTQASIANGIALKSAGDVLQAELLRADQRLIELQSSQQTYKDMLALFINVAIDDSTVFERPAMAAGKETINRPELSLYTLQKQSIALSCDLLAVRRKPKVELFVQGGYGRPALNMLENEFNLYYIGGIRFSWLLSGFYTFGREKQILALRQQGLDVQQETFLFNTGLTLRQHAAEIVKLQRLIAVDEEIIGLRQKVKQTASLQLGEGAITPTDYIREVNAEDQARQNLVLHQTQLLMARARHQFTSGN
jgi:outer membrane protein TolC